MTRSLFVPNMTGKTLCEGRFALSKILGAGSYGKVYRAISTCNLNKDTPLRAIKCMAVAEQGSQTAMLQASETDLHARVSGHSSIVTLHKIFVEDELLFFVMDLCPGGNMSSLISSGHFYLKDETLKSAFLQILDALQHCHRNGVYHRDIKPDNIFCSADKTHFYLGDFGLATTNSMSRQFRCGTKQFMSPECVGNENDLFKFYLPSANDIWALGVLFTCAVTNHFPWRLAHDSDISFARFLEDDNHLHVLFPLSDGFHKLITGMFRHEPTSRTSLAGIHSALTSMSTFYPKPNAYGHVVPTKLPSWLENSSDSLSTSSDPSVVNLEPKGHWEGDSTSSGSCVEDSGVPPIPILMVQSASQSSASSVPGPITPPSAPVLPSTQIPGKLEGIGSGVMFHLDSRRPENVALSSKPACFSPSRPRVTELSVKDSEVLPIPTVQYVFQASPSTAPCSALVPLSSATVPSIPSEFEGIGSGLMFNLMLNDVLSGPVSSAPRPVLAPLSAAVASSIPSSVEEIGSGLVFNLTLNNAVSRPIAAFLPRATAREKTTKRFGDHWLAQ